MFDNITNRSDSPVMVDNWPVLIVILLILSISAGAQSSVAKPQLIGPEDDSKQIEVTYWLNLHNKTELDTLVRQMYDEKSNQYHHWLTSSEYRTRFAPTAADMAVVKKHLAANHLEVVHTDPLNHAVTARGTVLDVKHATGLQINRMLIKGQERRVASGELAISDAASKVVFTVEGITELEYTNFAMRAKDPATGKFFSGVSLGKAGMTAIPDKTTKYFNANCLHGDSTLHLKTPPSGPYAYETYTGARYGGSITAQAPNLPNCGYDAGQVQHAYGLTSLYKQRLKGQGQNIVVVDAYGDDYITSDANMFSAINALPALTENSNFWIFYPTGPTNCTDNNCGWDAETSLDVEWSHAMAPDATIVLVLASTSSLANLDLSELWAIDEQVGPVISNSWGFPESVLIAQDPGELTVENNIAETAAALGISLNFATGDAGDNAAAEGAPTVNMPSASPYVTAVGGTSLFLDNSSIKLQTGWGNNLTGISSYSSGCGAPPCNPVLLVPVFYGFQGGAGGGTSTYWSRPSFQSQLPEAGNYRLTPDIAFLADPFTGAEFVDTEQGEQFVAVAGGTSLATPLFSGLWSIANQATNTWLGQAAPMLYRLPSGAITDIVPVTGPDNVTGLTAYPPADPTYYTATQLAGPLDNDVDNNSFMSLLFQSPLDTWWYVLSFGTDSSLATGPGWDYVTGLGTPNGANFITAVQSAVK